MGGPGCRNLAGPGPRPLLSSSSEVSSLTVRRPKFGGCRRRRRPRVRGAGQLSRLLKVGLGWRGRGLGGRGAGWAGGAQGSSGR